MGEGGNEIKLPSIPVGIIEAPLIFFRSFPFNVDFKEVMPSNLVPRAFSYKVGRAVLSNEIALGTS